MRHNNLRTSWSPKLVVLVTLEEYFSWGVGGSFTYFDSDVFQSHSNTEKDLTVRHVILELLHEAFADGLKPSLSQHSDDLGIEGCYYIVIGGDCWRVWGVGKSIAVIFFEVFESDVLDVVDETVFHGM